MLSKDSTIVIEIDDANIPAVIKEAMSCKSRTDVLAYIKSNLITAVPSADNRKYQINTPSDTSTLVALYHRHFRSDEGELSGHYCIKGAVHKDTPQKMHDFVEARERLFNESFEAGRRYQETSWVNPSWVGAKAGNKIKSIENAVARSPFGLFIPAKSSRHCEDFEKGVKAATRP